jgi:SAM-dependent methyltransferase
MHGGVTLIQSRPTSRHAEPCGSQCVERTFLPRAIRCIMPERPYDGDPLTPGEREALEDDLISFAERELDLLGDLRGLDVLYAGGASPLWLEGLSQRIGEEGGLTALEADTERVREGREALGDAALAAPVRIVEGDVFEPPFEPRTFDLVYSAGLFHELDVRERGADAALAALVSVVKPGGRVATSDFVGAVPAVQLEDEELRADLVRELSGVRLYGVGPPERLVGLHEALLDDVRWGVSPPWQVRHLDRLILAEGEAVGVRGRLRRRREALRERMRREGYTRPATLYVEGVVPGG